MQVISNAEYSGRAILQMITACTPKSHRESVNDSITISKLRGKEASLELSGYFCIDPLKKIAH